MAYFTLFLGIGTKLASNAEWYTLCILLCKIACWGGPQSPRQLLSGAGCAFLWNAFPGRSPIGCQWKDPGAFYQPSIRKKLSAVLCAEPLFLSPFLFHHTQVAGQHWPLPSANHAFPAGCRSIQDRAFSFPTEVKHRETVINGKTCIAPESDALT